MWTTSQTRVTHSHGGSLSITADLSCGESADQGCLTVACVQLFQALMKKFTACRMLCFLWSAASHNGQVYQVRWWMMKGWQGTEIPITSLHKTSPKLPNGDIIN